MPFASTDASEFVFLGGTTTGYDWRRELIPLLHVNYFDPIVDNWTEACAREENEAKEKASMNVFVISPDATGLYSVAEMTEQAMMHPKQTVVHFLDRGKSEWTESQMGSNKQILALMAKHGAMVATSLEQVAMLVNDRLVPLSRVQQWAQH